jgi:hypothetical protein
LENNRTKIFIGHCFYGEKRIKKYRKLFFDIFGNTYSILFGTPESFKDYSHFFREIQKLIKKSRYCIFDLTGYNKKKLALNLNVLLEAGISIGAGKRCYILTPSKGKFFSLVKQISDFSGHNVTFFKKREFNKKLKLLKANIDEWEKGRKLKPKSKKRISYVKRKTKA